MPGSEQLFAGFDHVRSFDSSCFQQYALDDIDVLAIRSTINVDQQLLARAPNLKLVVTATSGFDHIDTALLDTEGISWAHSGGCNASSVAEYVLSAICNSWHVGWRAQTANHLSDLTVGIVGFGFVGKAVSSLLSACGISWVAFDPFVESASGQWSDIIDCDVISLHTPLTEVGPHATRGMIDADTLNSLSSHQLLINASRGGVIEHSALVDVFAKSNRPFMVFDVWPEEPNYRPDLVSQTQLATPHIAGHSIEAKLRGTQMCAQVIGEFLGVSMDSCDITPLHETPSVTRMPDDIASPSDFLLQLMQQHYWVQNDDRVFRAYMAESRDFVKLRKTYPARFEITSRDIELEAHQAEFRKLAEQLGFNTINIR